MGVLPVGRGSNNARVVQVKRVVMKQAGSRLHVLPNAVYPDADMCLMTDELRLARSSKYELQQTVRVLKERASEL